MPIIEIEVSKIMKIEQEFLLTRIIDEAISKINLTGLRVLSNNYPKFRKELKGGKKQ